jgi:hypothetical protein
VGDYLGVINSCREDFHHKNFHIPMPNPYFSKKNHKTVCCYSAIVKGMYLISVSQFYYFCEIMASGSESSPFQRMQSMSN